MYSKSSRNRLARIFVLALTLLCLTSWTTFRTHSHNNLARPNPSHKASASPPPGTEALNAASALPVIDSNSTAILAASTTIIKPNDDVVGQAVTYGNNSVYFSAQWHPNSPADDGETLVGKFAAPLTNGAAPLWMRQWPDGNAPFSTTGCLNGPVTGNGYDTFRSIALGADGAYFGGASYNQTADAAGCKEQKEIVAKFNLNGAAGGFDAAGAVSLWRQRFGTTYGYDGYESFDALVSSVENGTTYIYGSGAAQINCGNGSGIRKYDTSGNQIWQYADCASGGGYNALAIIGSNIYASYSANGVPTIRRFPLAGSSPTATFGGTVDAGYNGGGYTSLAALNGNLYAAGYYYTTAEKQVYLLDGWDTNGTRFFHKVWSSDSTKANGQQLNSVVAVGQRLFAIGWTRNTDSPATAHNMGGSTTPVFPDSSGYHGYGDGVIFEINPGDGSLLSTTGYGTNDGRDEAFVGATTDGADLYVIGGERDAGGQFYHAVLLRYTFCTGTGDAPPTFDPVGNQHEPAFAPPGVPQTLSAVRFEWLGTCGGDPITFYLNGVPTPTFNANAGGCTCTPPLASYTSIDANLLGQYSPNGTNMLRLSKPSGSTAFSWGRATLIASDGRTLTRPIFDYNGGDATELNVCNASFCFCTFDQSNTFAPFTTADWGSPPPPTYTLELTGVSIGDGNSCQVLSFNASSSNTSVVNNVSVSYGGATTATLTFSVAGNGTAVITVTATDSPANTSTTRQFIVTVGTTPATTAAVESSANPSTYGQPVTFTATVSGTGGTPTGSVRFDADGDTACAAAPLVGGVATCATSALSAGTHTITATYGGDSTFNGSTGTLTQEVSKATPTLTTSGGTFTYDRSPHASTGTAKGVDGMTDVSGTFIYTYTPGGASAPVNASATPYSVTAMFTSTDPNYNSGGTATNTITIDRRDATWTTDDSGKTYGDPNPVPLTSGSGSNFVAGDGVGATYSRAPGETVGGGPYHITAILSAGTAGALDNYNITNNGASFNIGRRPLTVTADAVSKTYGDADPDLTYQVTGGSLAFNDGFSGSPARGPGEDVGDYAISQNTLTAGDNYALTFVGATFSITKAESTVTVNCPASEAYTGAPIEPCTARATGAGGLDESLTVTYTNNTDAGHASASATYAGDANHTGSTGGGGFTIGKAPSTTVLTFDPGPYVYRGTAFTATASVTGVGGLNAPVNVSYSGDCTNVTAASGCVATANYAGDANHDASGDSKSITIGKAEQSITWGDPSSIVYGTALSSAQLNATVAVIGPSPAGALMYSPAAGAVLHAGTHQPLTVNAAATNNYNAASKTVYIDELKAVPVINWATPAAITYGVVLSAAQLNATATHPSDGGPLSGANVPGTFAYVPAAGAVLPVGNNILSVTFIPANASDYTASSAAVVQRVNYGVCVLYDQTKASKSGSTIPIKLQLCNAAGVNQSSPAVTVTAVGVRLVSPNAWGGVEAAGRSNPDMNFRYTMFDPNTGGYIFNLQTKGLTTGVYQLGFTVGGDPNVYIVQFQIK